MEESYKRRSRRSHPNLPQLSITPLMPNYPVSGDDDDHTATEDRQNITSTPQSYIAPRSLPQTPSILSRSTSKVRKPGSRSTAALNELGANSDVLAVDSLALRQTKSAHARSLSNKSLSRPPDSTDWILHTASALTVSTAESKGQAWLATRSSSTSLADTAGTGERLDPSYTADDEFSPVSYRHASRGSSRFGSRGTSRRGSKVGIMTPLGVRTPGERDTPQQNYFDTVQPDFVDAIEEDDDPEIEDGEVKKVIWGHVGGWVDWAVGWMDFRNEEGDSIQHESMQEDVASAKTDEKGPPRRKIKWKQKRPSRDDRLMVQIPTTRVIPPAPDNEGVVQDAAWLLGLARNNFV